MVATLEAEIVDVSVQRLRDPQPVEREQREQGVFSLGADPGLDHERRQLRPVQAEGSGLVVDLRSADVGGRASFDMASCSQYR